MRSPRLLLALATLFLGVGGTVVASGAGAAPSPPCGGHVLPDGPGWTMVDPPFPAGPAQVTEAVATPYLPDRVYVTNGSSVLQSDDGGCSWRRLVVPDPGGTLGLLPEPLDGLLKVPSDFHVAALAAPSSATATGQLYVGFDDRSQLTSRPRVYAFDGQGHGVLASGLPRSGTVAAISATASIGDNVYVLIDPANRFDSDGGIYASSDGGRTFSRQSSTETSGSLRGMRADPLVPSIVYGIGRSGLRASADGGRAFAPIGRPAGDISSYDVTLGGGSVGIVAGHTGRHAYDRSRDGGGSFATVTAPVAAKQVALQPLIGQVAVSDGVRLWLEPADSVAKARDVTPTRGAPTGDLQFTAPSGAGYALYGVRDGSLVRGVFALDGSVVRLGADGRPVRLLPATPPKQFPSTLTPDRTKVALPPGGHRDLTYKLLLPRTPSPVDVMFLVDTSSSTEQMINGLKDDLATIVNDLAGVGLDTQFGVGDFKDYSPTVADRGNGEIGDYAYRLDRVIGPADAALRQALSRLKASGGGDPAESQLTALYQSTTGVGQHYPGRSTYIKDLHPGIGARYRPDSLRLAVLATDDHFHREKSYLTPTWDKTVAALRDNHVFPIGLAVERIDKQQTAAHGETYVRKGFHSYRTEQELAAATGSIAPAGGVDCNGDLVPDVAAGAPFVCKVPGNIHQTLHAGVLQTKATVLPVRLGPAITRAAETLPDPKSVGLRFTGRGRHIARLVSPQRLPTVNLKTDNTLSFTVRYTCPRLHHGKVFDLGVDAAAGARVVASSAVRVSCSPLAPHKPAVVPPPGAAAVAAAAPAAAPPPPAPGNPIPNPNPNPNPALNANVGFASQEEEQRQLAFAGADAGAEVDPGESLAMSRLSQQQPFSAADSGSGESDAMWFYGVALLLTGAAGLAWRRRTSVAVARSRSWHHS